MKKTFAALFALVALIALPAAADTPATTDVAPAPAVCDLAPAALELQGPPADLPNEGFACELPPQQRDESCICPLVFDPVCGCNGVTYTNACFAECEVRSYSEGACDDGGTEI